ncbi:MAG: S-layer homology domain-containing protein [Eubacteriales bacterium]|nr:S-layer homology domain-containing protein [Eubacteriales bacterium]
MTNFKTAVRRLASLMLALMLTASMAVSVSAKNYTDVIDNDYTEQIDMLSDIGIMIGTSEDEFSPDMDVTREQMALLLFRTMLGRDNSGTVNTTAFEDLYDPTYHGAISWANAAGYIIGTSDTTFEPVGGITLQDAMTMIVRALGQSHSAMDRGYPWTYIDAAVKLGLDEGLNNISYTKTLTRAETATLVYNALTAQYLIPKTSSAGTYVVSTTIVENVYGFEIDEGIVVATNDYTIEGYSKVIKNGYVTLEMSDGVSMTVNFDELNMEGSPESWLGKKIKLVYKADEKTKLVTVFGSSYAGVSKNIDTVEIAVDGSIVMDGVKYETVAAKSGTLSTNKNEIYVYIYDNDGKLAKLADNAAVSSALRFFNLELIRDNAGSDAADRAIIKPWSFGQLTITGGQINIAGNLAEDQLTGGFVNNVNAKNGDYVLYYYNAENKSLEIPEVLIATPGAVVTRLTAASATIGGVEYKLTYAPANALNIGQNASVIAKNGYILAVVNAPAVTAESTYLIATSNASSVYIDGYVRYAFTANVDGVSKNIITSQPAVTVNGVYRYTVDANGIYSLYDTGSAFFVQNGDFSSIFNNINAATISTASSPYYQLGNVKFVTDNNTVIIVKNNGVYTAKTGAYTGDITINANASVVSVFKNNIGDVKTLSFLFISDGSLARTDITQTYVKVLAANGSEYVNNTVYYVYTVLNISSGQISANRSVYSNLAIGNVYATDAAGNILNIAADLLASARITGYTASTVTIGGATFRLTANTKAIKLNADNTATAVTPASLLNTTVTYYAVNGDMILIISPLNTPDTLTGIVSSGSPADYPNIPAVIVENYTGKTVNDLKNISMDIKVISGANEPAYFVMTANNGGADVYITSWFKPFTTAAGTVNHVVWGEDAYEITAGTGYAVADATHSNVAGGSGATDLVGQAFYDEFGGYTVTKVEVKMFGGPQTIEVSNYAD